jgi:hypothetical protein
MEYIIRSYRLRTVSLKFREWGSAHMEDLETFFTSLKVPDDEEFQVKVFELYGEYQVLMMRSVGGRTGVVRITNISFGRYVDDIRRSCEEVERYRSRRVVICCHILFF